MKNLKTIITIMLPLSVGAVVSLAFPLLPRGGRELNAPPGNAPDKSNSIKPQVGVLVFDTRGTIPGNMENATDDLTHIFDGIQLFREQNEGRYPGRFGDIFPLLWKKIPYNGEKSRANNKKHSEKVFQIFTNPDVALADNPGMRQSADSIVPYYFINRRLDGTETGSAKPIGTRDLLSYTTIYYHVNSFISAADETINNPVGFYPVLWDDGAVEVIPYDLALSAFNAKNNSFRVGFSTQAGLPFDTLTYGEYWVHHNKAEAPLGKPILDDRTAPTEDNGGPESLLALTRILNFPTRFGISRDLLWRHFSAAESQFDLEEIQSGATKLDFATKIERLPLSAAKFQSNPALLFMKDDGRIVLLANIDEDLGVIIDRGITQVVERKSIESRYSGEVLFGKNAVETEAVAIMDPVRKVYLKSRDAHVTETFELQNRSNRPVTLQVNSTPPGTLQVQLGAATLQPGQKTNLVVTAKWRTILNAPTQNLMVSLGTDVPEVPNLICALSLVAPETP